MIEELQKLGLTQNESKVYITLLNLKTTTTEPLIKKTKLHRQLVYNALNSLKDQGLITFTLKGNKKAYSATSPELIKTKIDALRKTADEIIPKLKEIQEQSIRKNEAKIYSGKNGLRSVLLSSLKNMKQEDTFYIMGAQGDRFAEETEFFYEHWNKAREKKKIKRKIITYEKQYKELRRILKKEKFHQIKKIPEETEVPATTWIYKNHIAIVIWNKEPLIISIESESAYQAYLKYFKILWKNAK